MLIVNPEERVKIIDVVKYCEDQIKVAEKREVKSSMSIEAPVQDTPVKKKFTIDPCLIMDDIVEKLVLLDYGKKFCSTRGHK